MVPLVCDTYPRAYDPTMHFQHCHCVAHCLHHSTRSTDICTTPPLSSIIQTTTRWAWALPIPPPSMQRSNISLPRSIFEVEECEVFQDVLQAQTPPPSWQVSTRRGVSSPIHTLLHVECLSTYTLSETVSAKPLRPSHCHGELGHWCRLDPTTSNLGCWIQSWNVFIHPSLPGMSHCRCSLTQFIVYFAHHSIIGPAPLLHHCDEYWQWEKSGAPSACARYPRYAEGHVA